ncbi:MAG TPA: urease accessory UreF family protein [Verrucomicrobiae bacterium]|nr:urease accessory UreF family protein [Verrucomicrobiae bacterium]
MLHQTQPAATAELLGDLRSLIEQIGSPEGLMTLAGEHHGRHITTAAELRRFLQNYHSQVLHPCELPAIQRAFNHASRNELRELIAFDKELEKEMVLRNFVSASRRVGQNQLQRLRPLRDHRLVQRYLMAVEKGEATGWHTLVYGLTLSIYSVPLRQGLFGYARQTTRGFIHSAARSLRLSEMESGNLLEEVSTGLPAAVEGLMTPLG